MHIMCKLGLMAHPPNKPQPVGKGQTCGLLGVTQTTSPGSNHALAQGSMAATGPEEEQTSQ